MITKKDWNSLVACMKANDRVQANALHDQITSQINEIKNHALFRHSDISKLVFKCVQNSLKIEKIEPKSLTCCLTHQHDSLVGIKFKMIYSHENPQELFYDEKLQDIEVTIHKNLLFFVRCVAQVCMIWYYILQCIQNNEEPNYEIYSNPSVYIQECLVLFDQ